MTEHDDIDRDPQRTAAEQRALAALRVLAPAQPSAAARARARAAFVSGPPARRVASTWVPLALAAVLVVALFAAWRWAAQPRYQWRVTDVVAPAGILAASGDVQVGGVQRGGPLRTAPDSEIELQLGEEFRFRLLGGSSIELPAAPPRWYSGEILITVLEGEIYGTTGAGTLDLPLRVVARDAEAEIRGTTFAVFQEPEFTCVCLWEGTVLAGSRVAGSTARVQLPDQHKVMFYPDGSVSENLPLEPAERMKLQMMADGGVPPALPVQK